MSDNENIQVPVLRNDESESLQERMTENAYSQILPARYLKKNENGEVVEEQEELFQRVAKNIAVAEAVHTSDDLKHVDVDCIHGHFDQEDVGYDLSFGTIPLNEETARYFSYDKLLDEFTNSEHYEETVEVMKTWKNKFQDMMEHLKLMPNSPTLFNAGSELQMLSACFVLEIEDDMSDIHETAKSAAQVFQGGGGCGYPFSSIRPYGDTVGSTGGIASGPISFMNTLDQVCSTVAQAGVRRGAQMGVMEITHPDIPYFIHAKNTDVSLAQTLLLNDPDDPKHTKFGEALKEARKLIDDDGCVPEHLRNAAEGHLSNFNISVAVSDEFMEALENDKEFTLINPRTEEPHIATEETKELYGWFDMDEYVTVGEKLSVPASELWDRIIGGAHSNGEPGVIYMDEVNRHNTFDLEEYPKHIIKSTNPCSEEPLEDGDACNLNHINLSTIVNEDAWTWDSSYKNEAEMNGLEGSVEGFLDQAIDWDELNERIEVAIRFLDNVVTMSDFPVEKIDNVVQQQRKIGLGIMGLAQLFVQLGVRYGDDVSEEISRQLMKHIHHKSKKVSHQLAEERGEFDNWDESKWANPTKFPEFFEHHTGLDAEKWEDGYLQRNHETTTVAPTGTTSQIANSSGGCEPIFSVCYFKNVTDDIQGDEMLIEFDNLFLETLEHNDINVESVKEEAVELMNNNDFDGVHSIPSVPSEVADLFVTADDLSPNDHASIQCSVQEGVGSGISKTVNAPNDSTVEDAKNVFEYIYDNGGKAVTYYRDGSRTKQVKTTRKENEIEGEEDTESTTRSQRKSPPKQAPATRIEVETGYGDLLVNIAEDENGHPVEVIANLGKAGGTMQSTTEALGRMASHALQYGMPVERVIDQLEGIKSPQIAYDEGETVHSIPDGISKALEWYQDSNSEVDMSEHDMKVEHTTVVPENHTNEQRDGEPCPECGEIMRKEEGCETCHSCGYSHC